jgi:hypothetical protein
MQETLIVIPEMAKYTKRFKKSCKRNRLELIADFPGGDEATSISSLEIHPRGWCALSRNTSANQDSEVCLSSHFSSVSNFKRLQWTCLHDIRQLPSKIHNNEDEDLELTHRDLLSREIIEAELSNTLTGKNIFKNNHRFVRSDRKNL